MTRDEILSKLRANKADIQKKYPVASLALFGSFARDEQTPESDVDIMVELDKPVGIEFVDLLIDLESILTGTKVDLVSKKGIKPRYWSYIKDDLIYV
jgi:uncharacterized protein